MIVLFLVYSIFADINYWPKTFNNGVNAFSKGKYEVAKEQFQSVLKNSPDTSLKLKSLFNMGNTEVHLGNTETAEKLFKKSISLCSNMSFIQKLFYSKLCKDITSRAKQNLELLKHIKKQKKQNKQDKKNNKQNKEQKNQKDKQNNQDNKTDNQNKKSNEDKNKQQETKTQSKKEKNKDKQQNKQQSAKKQSEKQERNKANRDKNLSSANKNTKKQQFYTKDIQKQLVDRAQTNDLKIQKALLKKILSKKKGENTGQSW